MVPAYLEAGAIGPKIQDLKQSILCFGGTAKIVVVASDDSTSEAAQRAGADTVLRVPRNGKASACNVGLKQSNADLVVFTDANCRIQPDDWIPIAIDSLKRYCLISANKSETNGNERLFWRFERLLKKTHGDHDSIAVVGEFLAFRRSDYREISTSAILDDMEIAIDFTLRNLRVGVCDQITVTEDAAAGRDQWERRVRIAEGHYVDVGRRMPALSRLPAGRRYLVHKMPRLTLGCIGFWAGVFAGSASSRPFAAIALPLVLSAGGIYRGLIKIDTESSMVGSLVAIVGMQFIPPAAAVRLIVRKIAPGASPQRGVWKKVSR
ncbi:glycosyltransferase [Gordonia amicalis]|uniref:glycosyltransferase n=1 Tax=Gordonia TaxID=2053 RepID=UPI0022B59D29|nr:MULTISPECIES: glycosyltransferase [Gordonia]MCZ4653820.1 glycosyltransferase [Gordonia amicalis]WJG14454.1 glycosyltransferase [Gordonia sp. Swx-4]